LFLHEHNSSNPLGVSTINDRIVFTPYYTVKDLLGVLLIIILFFYFVFYLPISVLDYYDNANEANSLVTPEHIIPE
jgi:ubiquinol-cytochrome c reductase cytochrome b subunit